MASRLIGVPTSWPTTTTNASPLLATTCSYRRPWVAIASLVYLIAIHKTEYFINARTVGAKISVASWEILAAMLTGEALFGVPGLVTAPLLYPFFKREIARLWNTGRHPATAVPAVPIPLRESAPRPPSAQSPAVMRADEIPQ